MIKPFQQNQRPLSTIIVSRPGVMQQSLRAALTAYSWVSVVASAGDGLTALNQVAQRRPGLLVIDSNLLDEEVESLLAAVKARSPATRCLICVQSGQREARLLAAGADLLIMYHPKAMATVKKNIDELCKPEAGVDHGAIGSGNF